MAVIEGRPEGRPEGRDATTPAAGATPPRPRPSRGFRPASRRRARLAGGAALAAVAVGGNVLVYSSLDDRTEALIVARNVRAGDQLTTDDLRIVEVDLDPSVPHVPADRIASVVGQYARVYIASGSMLVDVVLQPEPLVSAGLAIVAVPVEPNRAPANLLERSRVQLVIGGGDGVAPTVIEGRVVDLGARAEGANERFALSVEVAPLDAAVIAASDDVQVIVLESGDDPALGATP